jgi:cysteine desulfurase
MHANNEVGTLQPIREIARMARERGILLHTDAAQSAGKLPLNVVDLDVDLLTLAGHKFYAPKGVGALYVRAGTPIRSVLHGAEQEHGLRPGTENVAAIVGLGAAAAWARDSLTATAQHLRALRDRLHGQLSAAVPDLRLNGHPEHRLPNTLHVSFPGVSGRALLADAADVVAASVGSACHSEHDAVSGVLAAMGADAARAAGAVRLSVGRMTTPEEVERAAAGLIAAWQRLRSR